MQKSWISVTTTTTSTATTTTTTTTTTSTTIEHIPVNCGIFILLCYHQKRVGLRVGSRVGTEVMNVYPINHLGLWPLVVVVVLDTVGHVLAYIAVLHLNVAPGKINGLEGVNSGK